VDPNRLAYVGHSCDASAGAFLSGVDKRFKAFVIMAGDISLEVDKKTKAFQEYRQKVGPEKFDSFTEQYSWQDEGKYISHAAPAAVFLQYATDEPFLNAEVAKQYLEAVSEPKKLKIYDAPHALNAEATRGPYLFSGRSTFLQTAGRQSRQHYTRSRAAALATAVAASLRLTTTPSGGVFSRGASQSPLAVA